MDETLIAELEDKGQVWADEGQALEMAEYVIRVDPGLEIYAMVGRHRRKADGMVDGDAAYEKYVFFDKRKWKADDFGILEKIASD